MLSWMFLDLGSFVVGLWLTCPITNSLIPISTPGQNIIAHLEQVQVFETRLILDSTVTLGSHVIRGRPEKGPIALSLTDGLRIFMTKDHINSALPLYELVEKLSTLCGIKGENHKSLLRFVLSEENPERIEDEFQRNGISSEEDSIESGTEGRIISVEQLFKNPNIPQLIIRVGSWQIVSPQLCQYPAGFESESPHGFNLSPRSPQRQDHDSVAANKYYPPIIEEVADVGSAPLLPRDSLNTDQIEDVFVSRREELEHISYLGEHRVRYKYHDM
jgi:hypothetical protein